MSHWMQGQVEDLNCSLQKMKEAIVNIMPEWEKHIQTSPEGNITVRSSHTGESKQGYHIRIPEGASAGIRYCDLGLKKLSDGKWRIEYDRGGLPTAMRDAPNALKDEVAAMTMKERASIDKLDMIEDSRENGRRQTIRMTPKQAQEFLENN